MKTGIATAALMFAIAGSAQASIVQVEIRGSVEFNQIRGGPLDKVVVPAGSSASIRFTLDSGDFQNDPTYPTRGYTINQSSFAAAFGSVTAGLENPFSAGTPMFVLRDNDPAVDGFFLANNTTFPYPPLPLDIPGKLGQFGCNFSVGYTGDTLSSLDILGAVGTYDYTGLTNFYWSTDDGGNDAMGMIFDSMTISVVPAPATLGVLGAFCLVRRRR